MWQKCVYVLLWSVGLFIATYGFLFDDVKWLLIANWSQKYQNPTLLAIVLFMIDSTYQFMLEDAEHKRGHAVVSWVLLTCVFIFYCVSCYISDLAAKGADLDVSWAFYALVPAWLFLIGIKFAVTQKIARTITHKVSPANVK